MKARLKDFTVNRDGSQNITVTVTGFDFSEKFDLLKDQDLDVEIEKHREKRSNNANAYFHVLVNKIAREIGESEEQTKYRLVTNYGVLARDEEGRCIMFRLHPTVDATKFYKYAVPFDRRTKDGVTYLVWKVYKDTHMMNTKEMSGLIDGAIAEAKELGIETATPAELARHKEQWEAYERRHGTSSE